MAGEYDAAIAAGAQVASTGLNVASAANANQKQRDWMTEQSDIQYARMIEQRDYTNNYNQMVSDPAYLQQRLKNAGLNPWLAQGKPEIIEAKMGNVPNAQTENRHRANVDLGAAAMAYTQTKMMQKQMQVADADIQTKIAQAQKTNAETNAIETLLPGQSEGLSLDNFNKGLQSEQIKQQTGKIQQEIQGLKSSKNLTDAQVKNVEIMTKKGLKEIDNLVLQGQLTQAKIRETQIATQIIEATAQSKIGAENARNNLVEQTGGMSDKSIQYVPGAIIGKGLNLIPSINTRTGTPYWPKKP